MNQKKSITKPKNLRKRRLQNGDHWYKSAGENKKIEVRTEICWVLCYIKVSLSKSFLLCMYFYKGFFKKTQITGSIEKISSMGKMRQTRYLRLITQMSLKKTFTIYFRPPWNGMKIGSLLDVHDYASYKHHSKCATFPWSSKMFYILRTYAFEAWKIFYGRLKSKSLAKIHTKWQNILKLTWAASEIWISKIHSKVTFPLRKNV